MTKEITLEELEKELGNNWISEYLNDGIVIGEFYGTEAIEVWIPEDLYNGTDIGEFFDYDEDEESNTYRVKYV